MKKTLNDLYREHKGKLSDKWSLYLTEMDRLFDPYRDRPIGLLEIGIQNGGSLEIWDKYFSNAGKIVGCDIDPKCGALRYLSPRIAVVIGDANSDKYENEILGHASTFDIIIDDGSHKSSDIVKSFARYFPHLDDEGIYVVEDLHSSYWSDFEGGLYDPLSAMSFFKRLTDVINHEHWRNDKSAGDLVARFGDEYGANFENLDFSRIHSVEFMNSLSVIKKSSPEKSTLGQRIIVGRKEEVTTGTKKYDGAVIQDFDTHIKDDSNLDVFELIARNDSLVQSIQNLTGELAEREQVMSRLSAQLAEREQAARKLAAQIEALQTSTQTQLAERDAQINEIVHSKAWKIALLFRRIRVWIAPPNSRRAHLMRQFTNFFFPKEKTGEDLNYKDDLILIRSSGLFDESWYLHNNPDVAKSNKDPLLHYLFFGGFEGRDPSPNFSSRLYLHAYEDVKEMGINPLVHFLKFGRVEERLGDLTEMSEYERWIFLREPNLSALNKQRACINEFSIRPTIDLILPVFKRQITILDWVVQSILHQTYENWRLHLIISPAESAHVEGLLEKYIGTDGRIQSVLWDANISQSEAINIFLTRTAVEFVAFVENGDVLAPFALFEVVKEINQIPDVDLLFSDEDKITGLNGRFDPFFKPDYSPDTLRSINYMRHFLVIRKTLGDQIGWFRDGLDDAQFYDLVLRATEHTRNISHISKVLYHSRSIRGPEIELNHLAIDSAKSVLQEHLNRIGLAGRINNSVYPASYRISYPLPETPLVSILIPSQDNAKDLSRAIYSILTKSTYTNFEILIVENNSRQQDTFRLYERLQAFDGRVSVLTHNKPFNFSLINNWAAGRAKGEILLFLNNDIEVISANWLEEMLQQALRLDVAAVGAKLYYSDGTIQHAGIILGPTEGVALHEHLGAPPESVGYFGRLTYVRNVSAITAACMMVRKDVFDEVNGFDEHYVLAYGDVDLCLKFREKGWLNVWTPFAELYHFESRTRGYEDSLEKRARFKQELDYFLQKWDQTLKKGDPYYNSAFSMRSEDFKLNLG